METKEEKTLRSKVVGLVVEQVIVDNMFEFVGDFSESLQEKLNKTVKFPTIVHDVNIYDDNSVTGKVSFKEETGGLNLVKFEITN